MHGGSLMPTERCCRWILRCSLEAMQRWPQHIRRSRRRRGRPLVLEGRIYPGGEAWPTPQACSPCPAPSMGPQHRGRPITPSSARWRCLGDAAPTAESHRPQWCCTSPASASVPPSLRRPEFPPRGSRGLLYNQWIARLLPCRPFCRLRGIRVIPVETGSTVANRPT